MEIILHENDIEQAIEEYLKKQIGDREYTGSCNFFTDTSISPVTVTECRITVKKS
jgi:hypothetical protein